MSRCLSSTTSASPSTTSHARSPSSTRSCGRSAAPCRTPTGVSWYLGEEELILVPAREPGTGPHRHGQVGWQHLAFPVDSRAEVDRLHQIAMDAGWTAVSGPKPFPRFNDRYYAAFVEDDNGIRLEFMHNPPRAAVTD